MRNLAMMMAVLALAGCDVGKTTPPPPKVQADASVQAPQATTVQWEIQINANEALSDISAWLLERSYPPYLANIEGKQQLLIGPYATQAQAEQTRTELLAKLAKSHRKAAPVVIERTF
ncbi:SPOR domain-containing protein [Pseudomonas caspiana]